MARMNDKYPVALRTQHYVIRAGENEKGELEVYAHRLDTNGNESQPRGYMLGFNSLLMTEPTRK
jgi:hypothetical protein